MKNLEFLAVAIVGQAAKDYETAYRKNDKKALKELEDWFSGEGAPLPFSKMPTDVKFTIIIIGEIMFQIRRINT